MIDHSYPKISVILPTYNVARYLHQCLDSIENQTYLNFEVIIIIDGATDGSYEISKEYCKKDFRFSVYWQENAGSGPARNAGLARTNSEFVMFVDPDDWLEPDCIEQLMKAQQEGNYDLTISGRLKCRFDKNDKFVSRNKDRGKDFIINGKKKCREAYMQIYEDQLVSAPTRIIYKMSLIKDNHIEFPAYRRSQDIVFNYRYFDCISSVRSIDYCGYNYRSSMANNIGKVRIEYIDTVVTIYNDIKVLHEKWRTNLNLSQLASIVFLHNLNMYLQVAAFYKYDVKQILNNAVIKEIIKEAKPDRFYLKIGKLLLMAGLNSIAMQLFRGVYAMKLNKLI